MKSLKVVQTISKVMSILVMIAFVFTVIGAAGCILGGSVLLMVPGLNEMIAQFAVSDVEMSNSFDMGVSVIAEAVFLIGQAVALWFMHMYFKHELEDGTPFTYNGANELLKVGIIQIAVPIGALCIAALITAIAGVPEGILSNEADVVSGVTMILLSFVFKYGAELEEKNRKVQENYEENN